MENDKSIVKKESFIKRLFERGLYGDIKKVFNPSEFDYRTNMVVLYILGNIALAFFVPIFLLFFAFQCDNQNLVDCHSFLADLIVFFIGSMFYYSIAIAFISTFLLLKKRNKIAFQLTSGNCILALIMVPILWIIFNVIN